ncbi:MAG: hypothetical protein M3R61_01935 [Chloroflexota bacterium]|nr:hypothetical protein [Chloroflexota bacterium]
MAHDPVCGMQIAEADAYAERRVGGVSVYLCSAACVERFDASPQAYYPPLSAPPAATVGVATNRPVPAARVPERQIQPLLRPIAFGLLAVLGLLTFYLGIITLAQGWGHALQQLADDRWFIGAITLGFGAQVGLFTYLKGLHAHAAAGGVASC